MTSYRVLVVDDLPAVRRTVERVLVRNGHAVLTAASGEDACDVLEREQVDVVLMDLRMPTMSGRTLFQLILTKWPSLARRLAVMSGDPEADDHADWLGLHDLPIISKPFQVAELLAIVAHLGSRSEPTARDHGA